MDIHVTFRHLDHNEGVKEYAIEKLGKLERYFHDTIQVNIVFFLDRFNYIADITIIAKGKSLNVKEGTNDMLASIDLAVAKLERQLKKQKEKNKDHKAHATAEDVSQIYYEKEKDASIAFGHGSPTIINSKQYDFNPMAIKDATLLIEKKKKAFVVFNNVENKNNLTILYKLGTGDYGIMEPTGEPQEILIKDFQGRERKVIPSKDLYAHDLTVNESIDAINKKNSSFIVFKNRTSENLNIVYKKRNGELGLIEV